MSTGLLRGTVAVEPHRIEWEISAQEIIDKLKNLLQEDMVDAHHIHVVIWGQEIWSNYINFRDYLNCHEEDAKKYSQLKKALARQYPEDRSTYTSGKNEYIELILHKAKEWRHY